MPALFDPARHEPLAAEAWDEARVREQVAAIAADAVEAFEPARDGWPIHPLDEPGDADSVFDMLYMGGGGVLWALERLRELGATERRIDDRAALVVRLVERNRALLETWGYGTDGYIMGEAGLRLLEFRLAPSGVVSARLHELVENNLEHPAREFLWGSPGSMVAAIHMAEATGESRWHRLLQRAATELFEQMVHDERLGGWLWQQELYGRKVRYLGAGHGFAGNAFAFLRGAKLLSGDLVDALCARALHTCSATALRDGDALNWHPMFDPELTPGKQPLVQDCHGAPGLVCRLAGAPRTPAWDALLEAAGELTWRAGPLTKGANICHGTAGNGYALLKLYRRSGDARWLDRARAFAMHALGQVAQARSRYGHARHSLWTGDVGSALYAWDCIEGDAAFPSLDVFL